MIFTASQFFEISPPVSKTPWRSSGSGPLRVESRIKYGVPGIDSCY